MKAFIGMGLLGSNFTRALLQKGNEVQVWNRTAAKAKQLEQYGAKAFDNAADAVKGADIIHVTLKDDASVDEVLAQASESFMPGAVIIDHTTTTVKGAIERTKQWAGRGITYQHAPVFMGPQNALEGTGFMLVSGNQQTIGKLHNELTVLTGKLLNLGEETGKAAALKLLGNLFLVTFTAGLADVLHLAKGLNVSADELLSLFSEWNPANMLKGRLSKIASADYETPSWELDMARKDTRLFMETASETGATLNVIPAIAQLMDKFIAAGYGSKDWTVIGSQAK